MNRVYIVGLEKCSIFKISCQNHRFKHLNFSYIYPISYKNAKKANPAKWICPIQKRYHNQLKRCQNSGYIADIKTSTGFISSQNLYILRVLFVT